MIGSLLLGNYRSGKVEWRKALRPAGIWCMHVFDTQTLDSLESVIYSCFYTFYCQMHYQ